MKYGTLNGLIDIPKEIETLHPRSEFRDARDVMVLDSGYRATGILGSRGDMLYRFPNEIGFGKT